MMFLPLFSKNQKKTQIVKALAKILLTSCAIIIILSGIALADRDVIIGFHKAVGQSEKDLIKNHSGVEKKSFHLIPAISARLSEDKIEKMKKDPKIAYIENDSVYQASNEYASSWGVQHIRSQAVHNQSINGTGVRIAVLDTGIIYTHDDLKNNYEGGYDFVNNDIDPLDDNCDTFAQTCHGTHVSGIIAAENNNMGVIGVSPNASIYAVKVLHASGSGNASWIIAGLQWAVDNNMDIATMSLGGPDDNIALHNAIDNAYNSGMLLVASAGNTKGGAVTYPAAYDSVIAVTATDANDRNSSDSANGDKIELAAPGVNVYSTKRGGYGYLSGTSMAAPHVTGVAALILSSDFNDINNDGVRNNTDVRAILQNSAKDLGDTGRDSLYGYGLVDASMAVLGHSEYPESADLSIIKNDNVDVFAAGDGKTYKYTIMVNNSGPTDASNVRVFDTWPLWFKRGYVTTSQGSCDTSTSSANFTCVLGTIVKDETATVNVEYTVSSYTPPGIYINRAQISSTTPDSNTVNNIAQDKNFVDLILTIHRTGGSPNNDAKKVSLSHGNYLIKISSVNLIKLDMKFLENGIIRKDLPSTFKFNKSKEVSFEVYGKDTLEIIFIPYGGKDSNGYVTIRSLS